MLIGLDKSQVLFQPEFKITDKITLRHSTVRDIIRLGEVHYFQVLSVLTGIPSDAKSFLWDNFQLDWEQVSDLEYFAMSTKNMDVSDSEIFLPGLDFSNFDLYKRPDGEVIYADKDNSITIDQLSHKRILESLCTIHKIKKKPEKAGNKRTHDILIEDDRDRKRLAELKKDKFESTLIPMISAMVNREGFKYNYQTVQDLLYGQFMDACARLQVVVATDQLISGIYNGTVDGKKIKKSQLDWMRDI